MSWAAANRKKSLARLLTPAGVLPPMAEAPKAMPPMATEPPAQSPLVPKPKFGRIKKLLGGM